MCQNNEPRPEVGNKSGQPSEVVSLCKHRKMRAIQESTTQLVAHLEAIHCEAIAVHNRIIERVELSVLTELCRTVGLTLDHICDELKASVLTPAALYGDTRGDVFGKKPLQARIGKNVGSAPAEDLFYQLSVGHPAVWEIDFGEDEPTPTAAPVGGVYRNCPQPIAAVICREGRCTDAPGVYTGWEVSFEGHRFVVFGHRLERHREVAVRDLLASRDDRDHPKLWIRAMLPLIRAICDPEGHHVQPATAMRSQAIRRPPSRRAFVLAIRRALWRQFCEPREGLTLHAHIAALVDDPRGYRAFVDEVEEIADAVTLKLGGLPEGVTTIGVDELLRPFFATRSGLLSPPKLMHHPAAVLLLEEPICDALGVTPHQPIETTLRRAGNAPDSTAARSLELTWMTYRTEQNLAATYGYGVGRVADEGEGDDESMPCVRRSPVLPNLRILSDPHFMEHTLGDLPLTSAVRSRLTRALEDGTWTLNSFRLDDIERDERQLTGLHGVSHRTCNAIRSALLQWIAHWRWRRCGLDPSWAGRFEKATGEELSKGLDLLMEFFDN